MFLSVVFVFSGSSIIEVVVVVVLAVTEVVFSVVTAVIVTSVVGVGLLVLVVETVFTFVVLGRASRHSSSES